MNVPVQRFDGQLVQFAEPDMVTQEAYKCLGRMNITSMDNLPESGAEPAQKERRPLCRD